MSVESQFVYFFQEYQVLIYFVIGSTIIGTILLNKYGDKINTGSSTFEGFNYEKQSLKEMFDGKIRKAVKHRGDKVGVPLYEGKSKRCYVYKELKKTEADEPIKIDLKASSKNSETQEVERIRIQIIGEKSSRTSRLKHKLKGSVMESGKVQIISEDIIKTETPDKMVLDSNVDWDYDDDLECWIASSVSTKNVKKRVIMDKTLNKLLEEFPNYVEKANSVNPLQSMWEQREEARKNDEDDVGV